MQSPDRANRDDRTDLPTAAPQARVAQQFTYQARLREAGLPAHGSYNMVFRLYDASAGGTLITSTGGIVAVNNGIFTVKPFWGTPDYPGQDRYLEVQVNGSILSPRHLITPAPYAFTADRLEWPVIETSDDYFFHLSRTSGDAAFFETEADGNWAFLGSIYAGLEGRTVDETGVLGQAEDGIGVHARRTTTTGTNPALYAESPSTSSYANAIVGEMTAASGGGFSCAMRGISNGAGSGGIGVWGSHAGSGYGVYGTTESGWAVRAQNGSNDASLFYGSQPDTTIDVGKHASGNGDDGLWIAESQTSSTDSAAIRAIHAAVGNDDAKAVWGINDDADYFGVGVQGDGGWVGVRGYALGTGSNSYYGVRGDAGAGAGGVCYSIYGGAPTGTGYSGYFAGSVNVTGALSKGAGSFKIDHPLDPYNKFLYHSFVESPDMKNIYDGTVLLNAQGMARIEMPDYFEALNTQFRYQLTAIGAPMPNLYVASEIQNGVFVVAGGVPGAKVSWQVTGVRQDAYANENRIPIEQWKQGREVGKLLHPTAFGRSANEGIDKSRELEEANKGNR